MKAERVGRIGAWLAGAWLGETAALGFIVAPTLFAMLPQADAGRVLGRLFELDATVGLAAGAVLAIVGLQLGQHMAERQTGSRFGIELGLALTALGCVVVGYYALQPMMESARIGQGPLSFGALHAISMVFFLVRLIAVGILAWRLSLSPSATS